MEDDSREYLKNLLNGKVFDPMEGLRQKTRDTMEKYAKEQARLRDYKNLEGFGDSFDSDLLQMITSGQTEIGYSSGSFMEYAEPYFATINDSMKAMSSQIASLKQLQTSKTEEDVQHADAVFKLIEGEIQELYRNTSLAKLKENDYGKQRLSEIVTDINQLYRFLTQVLQASS